MDIQTAKLRFQQNRSGARKRGIAWRFTFEEWLELWGDNLDKRGVHSDEYVLCRRHDLGCYEVGNCYIATAHHNGSVRGYMETRTNARNWGDEGDAPASLRCNPLKDLIAQEEELRDRAP